MSPKRTTRIGCRGCVEAETEKAEPEQAHGDGNGADMPEAQGGLLPRRKLEALLGSLVPDEDQK